MEINIFDKKLINNKSVFFLMKFKEEVYEKRQIKNI